MAESEDVLNAPSRRPSLALFDVDGTLTDTNVVDSKGFAAAVCEHLGLDSIGTDWSRFRHVTDSSIFDTICREHRGRGAEAADIARVQELLLAHFAHSPRQAFQPLPGARELLVFLRCDTEWRIAFATGAWACSARYKLEAAGLEATQPLASADDAFDRATIVRTAMTRAGGPFDRVVLLGDREWDASTAIQLGLPFIGVGDRLPGALPDFRDLPAVLNALRSARFSTQS